jgi:tellurite resistance protein TehA-like permease
MNPYTKAVAFVIRMVASGLILFTLFHYASYFFYMVAKKPIETTLPGWILKTVPLVAGLVLMFMSSKLARRFTDDLE